MESKILNAITRRSNSAEPIYNIVVTPRNRFIDILLQIDKGYNLYVYESEVVAGVHRARYPDSNVMSLYDFILLITRKIRIGYDGINPRLKGVDSWYRRRQFEKYNRGTFKLENFEGLDDWFDMDDDVYIRRASDEPTIIHETEPKIFEYMTFNDFDNIYLFIDVPDNYYNIAKHLYRLVSTDGVVISRITVFGDIGNIAQYIPKVLPDSGEDDATETVLNLKASAPDRIEFEGTRIQKQNIAASNLRDYLRNRRGALYFGPSSHRTSYNLVADYTVLPATKELLDNVVTESPWFVSWFIPSEIIESGLTGQNGSNNRYNHEVFNLAVVNSLPYVSIKQNFDRSILNPGDRLYVRLEILFDYTIDDATAEFTSKIPLPYQYGSLLHYWTSMNLPAFPLVITLIYVSRNYRIYVNTDPLQKLPETKSSSVAALAALYNELLEATDYNLINYQVIRQWCLADGRNYDPASIIVANEEILQFQNILGFDIGKFDVDNYVTTLSKFLQSYNYPIYTLVDGFYTYQDRNYTLNSVFKFTEKAPAIVALFRNTERILEYEVPVETETPTEDFVEE